MKPAPHYKYVVDRNGEYIFVDIFRSSSIEIQGFLWSGTTTSRKVLQQLASSTYVSMHKMQI